MRLIRLAAVSALWLSPWALDPASAAADFPACLQTLRTSALAHGVSESTFDTATAGLQPNDVLHFQDEQPEFTTPVWDYMAGLVDQERVDDGQAMLERYRDALARVEARFGVDRYTLVALWGVESDFGKNFGYRPIVQSLATLSCYGHKPAYYQSELFSALTILQQGDVKPDHFVGSWAGAFGHTQFMPSTFLRNGIDMEGDGHPDIVDSVPDALGSTAQLSQEVRLGLRLAVGLRGQAARELRGTDRPEEPPPRFVLDRTRPGPGRWPAARFRKRRGRVAALDRPQWTGLSRDAQLRRDLCL